MAFIIWFVEFVKIEQIWGILVKFRFYPIFNISICFLTCNIKLHLD